MKINKQIVIVFLFTIVFTACINDGGLSCTDQLVYGLSVTLKDTNSDEVITENTTVTARDGDYEEQLMLFPNGDNFVGAGERPGTYIIEVNATGYQPHMSSEITVDADECHVITEVIEILLLPD